MRGKIEDSSMANALGPAGRPPVQERDALELRARRPQAAHPEQVEVERRPHRVTQALEDVADLEARGQDRRQGRDGLQPLAPPALALQQHDVLDQRPDEVRDLAGRADVLVAEAAGCAAGREERAHDAPPGVERHADPGLEAGRGGPRGPAGRVHRRRQAGAVGDQLGVAVEDGPERGRLAGKPLARVEGDRVVVEIERDIGAVDAAREGAERAPPVLEPGDEHAVVGHQRLGARGEVMEKALRIERPFQGAGERRHAREQVRTLGAHSPTIVSQSSPRGAWCGTSRCYVVKAAPAGSRKLKAGSIGGSGAPKKSRRCTSGSSGDLRISGIAVCTSDFTIG
jgi:hypothetical protein